MTYVRTVKYILEKPGLIWLAIVVGYVGIFWTMTRHWPPSAAEQARITVVEQFAQSSFPPRISLIRELPDWGHVAYYAAAGRVSLFFKADLIQIRAVHLGLMLLAFALFVRLGYRFTYRNRLNPLWISLALAVFAANPYAGAAAFRVDHLGLLLCLVLTAMLFFERDRIVWSALFVSAAVLVDFRALLLALAFVLTRATAEQTRLLRPERLLAFLLPFAVAALPLLAWGGIVPQGEARAWLEQFYEKAPLMRLDGLFYTLALLPLYGIWFTWSWGIRARSRALVLGGVIAAIGIIPYFIFPPHGNWLEFTRTGSELPLGLVDEGAAIVAGPYKTLLLFVPWLAGAFLFGQLLLMDVLDRSRWLRYFIVFFFCVQPFVIGVSDREFLLVIPAILLLSLSEALVGEEGKLA